MSCDRHVEAAATYPLPSKARPGAQPRGSAMFAAVFTYCGRRARAGTTNLDPGHGAVAGPRGRPGAIVVEATGIRDVPSGPLLRIGHARFVPGLRRLTEAVRQQSNGRTRLLIQLIDFLSIRRRPDPKKFFAHFLTLTDRHRRAFGEPLRDEEIR